MRHSLLTTLCLSLLVTPALLPADEVILKNGRTLVGPTRKVGNRVEIETLDGKVVVKAEEVDWQRTRDDQALRIALARLATRSGAGSPHAQLELARVARSWGLYREMWAYLGKVLRNQDCSDVMRRRTTEFLADLEPVVLPKKYRKGHAKLKIRELLNRLRGPVPRAKVAAVAELMARVPKAEKHLQKRARKISNSVQRQASVRALALMKTPANDRFVYRTAILDRDPTVRQSAMRITREMRKEKDAIRYIAPLLLHDNARFRIRAAEAFGELRDVAAVPLLVAAGPTAGMMRKAIPPGATRAHMAVIQQVSFVRDFDVEVAASSFIADPRVDVLHAGTVLDVTVFAVTSHRVKVVDAYRQALRRLADSDPGPDPKTWDTWLAEWTKRTGPGLASSLTETRKKG